MGQLLGATALKTSRSLAFRQSRLLVGTGLLLIGLGTAIAWPASPTAAESTSGGGVAVPPGNEVRADSEARIEPLAELTETLATARSRLEELSRLANQVASDKSAADALEEQNREILAQLRALHADRQQLRDERDAAVTRNEELGEALQQATSISQALGEQLAAERKENSRLSRQEEELAAQLESLTAAIARAEDEVASLRGELESSQQRLADAVEERAQADAKLASLEERSSEAGQQIKALETQIAALEDQLKEKQAALEAMASLRTEREELSNRLAEIEADLEREKDEKDRLSAELAGFRTAAESATDLAREHLLTVEGKIKELNQAASASQPAEPEASPEPKAQPASGPARDGDLTVLGAPSASSGGGADDPQTPAKERADDYQFMPPAHAAEASADSSLHVILVEAMRKQREQLEGLMKDLGDGQKAPR